MKINKIISELNKSNIVTMPTETVYGLFSLISKENLEKLNRIKQREITKPIQIIFSSFEQILEYTVLSKFQNQILFQQLPSDRSFLVPSNDKLFSLINQKSVLVRFPDLNDPILKKTSKILKKIDKPLFATSANFTGQKELNSGRKIQRKFNIIGFNNKIKSKKSSMIISLLDDKIEIVRN